MNNEEKRRELQSKISDFEDAISDVKAEIATLDIMIENTRNNEEKVTLENKRQVRYWDLEESKQKLEGLQSQLVALRRFNRERCLNNVDWLLTKNNKKIGLLEMSSGNRPGYLSRMKSGKSSADPSIEFLLTASDELEVPLDLLVGSDLVELTPTEKFMIDFIRQMISDTNDEKLQWICETLNELEKMRMSYDMGDALHPLFKMGRDVIGDECMEVPVYNSLFFGDYVVRPCGNGYHTTLVPNDQEIYIMECIMEDENGSWSGSPFYEVYMVEYNEYGNIFTRKICHTLETDSPLQVSIESLVKAINISMSHVHIDDSVRSVIDAYMSRRKAEDENPDEE